MLKAAFTPAVGYVRMSTDMQDTSPEQQRSEIEKLAERMGATIIRWYEDLGISGDKTEKRADFIRMRHDAEKVGDFKLILVWDQDRFGRFDSMEAGYWIQPIRRAGVQLVTVTDGAIDWEDFGGRLIYSVKQEGKHQFLIDISRNTVRGQIRMAQSGCRNCVPPYGYDRMLVDEQGVHRTRVKVGEKIPKPKGWKSILVPGDADRVATVKWLFKTYASRSISLRELARELHKRGTPSTSGKPWTGDMVRSILRNPAYRGDNVWGRTSTGRYHQANGTEIKRVKTKGGKKVTTHAEEDWIVVENSHDPLIDRPTWEAVQAKLISNRDLTSPKKETYLLTGMMHCGHCGRRMHGWLQNSYASPERKKEYRYRTYLCSGYIRRGHASGCGYHSVKEQEVVALLVSKIQHVMLGGGNRDELERRIRERLQSADQSPGTVERLAKRLAELDRQIDQAADRLLKSPDDLVDVLAPKIAAMKRERSQTADNLAAAAKANGSASKNVDREVKAIADGLWKIAADLGSAEPSKLQELFRRMVARVDFWFERTEPGSPRKHRCTRGVIELRPQFFALAGVENTC